MARLQGVRGAQGSIWKGGSLSESRGSSGVEGGSGKPLPQRLPEMGLDPDAPGTGRQDSCLAVVQNKYPGAKHEKPYIIFRRPLGCDHSLDTPLGSVILGSSLCS